MKQLETASMVEDKVTRRNAEHMGTEWRTTG